MRLFPCVLLTSLLLAGALLAALPARAQNDGPAGTTIMGPVNRLPNGGRPQTKIPFPDVQDWHSLKITLTRSACFGSCPVYRVEIGGDGMVRYEGDHWTAVSGVHVTKIDPPAVHQLYDRFRQADFFWLQDSYRAPITDFPVFTIAIAFDGHAKTVSDYAGTMVGMPADVRALEDAVDAAAGTQRWTRGNADTVAALKAEGWDFHSASEANLNLLTSAALRNHDLLTALIAQGVPLKTPQGCEALSVLIQRNDVEMAKTLLVGGAPVSATVESHGNRYPCLVLQDAAATGNAALVAQVLDHHPDINAQDRIGRTALFTAVQGAVMPARRAADADYPAVIRLLRGHGGDLSIAAQMGLNPVAYLGKFGRALPPDRLATLNQALDADPGPRN